MFDVAHMDRQEADPEEISDGRYQTIVLQVKVSAHVSFENEFLHAHLE